MGAEDLNLRTFDRGWVPDADAVNAPSDVLLRADNLVLDQLGVVALRQGSTRINETPLSNTDVHSLFTVIRAGTKIRYGAAGTLVYRNAVTDIGVTMTGSGDVAFGSYQGQTFFTRGSSKYKDDGTTVRNWGIAMTGGAPEVESNIPSEIFEYASWDGAEEPDHEVIENNGDGTDYDDDRNEVALGAVKMFPADTGRVALKRTFDSDQDVTTLDGGREASDDDVIKFWLYASNPSVIQKTTLMIDVNGGNFTEDYYLKEWPGEGKAGPDGSVSNPGTPDTGGSVPPGDPGPGEAPLI